MSTAWIIHTIFNAAVWRAMRGVSPGMAALIAIGVVVLVLGVGMCRR
jgi:hypothetical protein